MKKQKQTFKVGQSVRIIRGPFKDKIGVVLEFEDSENLIVQFGALKVKIGAALLVEDETTPHRLTSSHAHPRKKTT